MPKLDIRSFKKPAFLMGRHAQTDNAKTYSKTNLRLASKTTALALIRLLR
jgi:hypothetical protein